MSNILRVLIVGDSDEDACAILQELRQGGYNAEYERVATSAAMSVALERGAWDVVLSAYSLEQFDAAGALRALRVAGVDLPLIVLSDAIGEEAAVAVVRAGAHDLIRRDHLNKLVPALTREVHAARTRRSDRDRGGKDNDADGPRHASRETVALTGLFGSVAHDCNNALTAILGNIEMMQDELRSELPEDDMLLVTLKQIEDSGRRMTALTNDVALLTRREPLGAETVDPNAVFRELAPTLRRVLAEDLTLELLLSPDVAPVRIPAGSLDQFALRLALDARRAMPKGGALVVETGNALPDETHPDRQSDLRVESHVVIAVSYATGATPSRLDSDSLDATGTTEAGETADETGLATIRELVSKADGRMRVKHVRGRGTMLRVYLPAATGPHRQSVDRHDVAERSRH